MTNRCLRNRGLKGVVADAAFGLGIFVVLAGLFAGGDDAAAGPAVISGILAAGENARSFVAGVALDPATAATSLVTAVLPSEAAIAEKILKNTSHLTAFLTLAAAFAALFAGNLAFFRHLRREYASPRRSAWRRD